MFPLAFTRLSRQLPSPPVLDLEEILSYICFMTSTMPVYSSTTDLLSLLEATTGSRLSPTTQSSASGSCGPSQRPYASTQHANVHARWLVTNEVRNSSATLTSDRRCEGFRVRICKKNINFQDHFRRFRQGVLSWPQLFLSGMCDPRAAPLQWQAHGLPGSLPDDNQFVSGLPA